MADKEGGMTRYICQKVDETDDPRFAVFGVTQTKLVHILHWCD